MTVLAIPAMQRDSTRSPVYSSDLVREPLELSNYWLIGLLGATKSSTLSRQTAQPIARCPAANPDFFVKRAVQRTHLGFMEIGNHLTEVIAETLYGWFLSVYNAFSCNYGNILSNQALAFPWINKYVRRISNPFSTACFIGPMK